MATNTMTMIMSQSRKGGKGAALAPERERFMQACAEIAHQLIQDQEEGQGKDTNLNTLRGKVSKKYKLKNTPSLAAIMGAIPEHYKKYISHKLLQKPVRM